MELYYIGKNTFRIIWSKRRIKNWGEVEQIAVEGSHEPIVTKEEFEKVRKMLDSKHFLLIIEDAGESIKPMMFGAES